MNKQIIYDYGLSNFNPLENIVCYDDFDRGLCGWTNLMPNYTSKGFLPTYTRDGAAETDGIVDKTQWGPIMLSSASFRFPGTHGSMNGTYSLKLSTRPEANKYEAPPAPGGMSFAIKRLNANKEPGLIQYEMWYSYTAEQDRWGIGDKDIRAIGICFDIQDKRGRSHIGARYVNSINGQLKQEWQFIQASDVSDEEWAYGSKGNWCKSGVDPFWYGRRYPDGSADSFKFIPNSKQGLCYNETDDKINWVYFRLLYDMKSKEYVEIQSRDKIFDLRGMKATVVEPYARIDGLINPLVWIESDTDRRAFLFIDSIVISTN